MFGRKGLYTVETLLKPDMYNSFDHLKPFVRIYYVLNLCKLITTY